MKIKKLLVILAVTFVAGSVCFADPFTGTWKLNEKKSRIPRGAAKNQKVVYENAFPFQNKVMIDGSDGHGRRMHSEWTGRFDGSDYKVTGDATTDTRSYREVNDNTLEFWSKKGGKVINSGRIVVAADGRSRTVTSVGTNAKGKNVRSTAFYDKQ